MLTLLQYPSISSLCDFLNSGEGPKFSQEDLHDRAKRQKSAMAGQKWARIALRRVNG